MLQHNRCLNCGREGHFLSECTSKGCRNCEGRKHHHTLCPKHASTSTSRTPPRYDKQPSPAKYQKPHTDTTQPRRQKSQQTVARANPVQTQVDDSSSNIPEVCPATTILHHAERGSGSHHVLLLTGIAQVRDEPNNRWKEVEILFDTGADQSFISQSLAEDLELECTKEQEFLMYTFGTDTPTQTQCGVTCLD